MEMIMIMSSVRIQFLKIQLEILNRDPDRTLG